MRGRVEALQVTDEVWRQVRGRREINEDVYG